ncbi:MAG: cyclic nucleotide-binding domain-containing protein [Candidatus Eremiobacteraeota bacterium]|nr:cyclic nucleotide-binding domain-containing protein [Candidatus Eremiobacteraeota bacterium]
MKKSGPSPTPKPQKKGRAETPTTSPVGVAHLALEEKISLLKETDIFCGFSERELKELCALIEMKHYPRGFTLFEEGSAGGEMFIVITGSVAISTDSPSFGRVIHVELKKNNFFGEMSLLDDRPRSARAVMLKEGLLISINKQNFRRLIKKFPQFSINLMSTLCERLRKANGLLSQLGEHLART